MSNKATQEEMRVEAVSRMKLIGLDQDYIDAFLNNEITAFWNKGIEGTRPDIITDAEECAIVQFENIRPVVVWAVIHDMGIEEGMEWDYYHLLFVSDDKEKWEEERGELLAMKPTVYCCAEETDHHHEYAEYVKIPIKVENGILYGTGIFFFFG